MLDIQLLRLPILEIDVVQLLNPLPGRGDKLTLGKDLNNRS